MPTDNLRAMYARGTGIYPRVPYLNGKSTTIQAGEPVILTNAAALTTASNPVVRTIVADDIADFADSPAGGILGVALSDAVTNSSGVAATQYVYASKATAAEPINMIPSYGMGQPVDSNIGYTQIMVAIFVPGVVFRGKLKSGVVGSNLLIGATVGLDLTAGVFTLDTAATTKVFNVVGWDPSDTTFVFFELMPTYCQVLSGFLADN